MSDYPFGELELHSYGLIYADPATRFVTHSERGNLKAPPYPTMSKSELLRLPVHRLAAPNCGLVMWSTREQIDFSIDLLKRWGFEYKTMGTWGKLSRTGKARHFGKGYWWRDSSEPWVFGTIGAPKNHSHRERSHIEWPVHEHSRKPPELHEQLERMFPRVRKVELFSRCRRPGWDHWGNEIDKFDPEAP